MVLVGGQANWHVKPKLPNSYVIYLGCLVFWDCRQFINAPTIGVQNSTKVSTMFFINVRQSHKHLRSTMCNMGLDDRENHALFVNKCVI